MEVCVVVVLDFQFLVRNFSNFLTVFKYNKNEQERTAQHCLNIFELRSTYILQISGSKVEFFEM